VNPQHQHKTPYEARNNKHPSARTGAGRAALGLSVINSQSRFPGSPMAAEHRTQNHTATLLHHRQDTGAGGYGGGVIFPAPSVYDPTTGNWNSDRNLTTARSEHTATLLLNGKVLVAGGVSSGSGQPFPTRNVRSGHRAVERRPVRWDTRASLNTATAAARWQGIGRGWLAGSHQRPFPGRTV